MPLYDRPTPVELGQWLPDLPALRNKGALVCKNCLPLSDSYTELRSLSEFSSALDAPCNGAIWLQDRLNTFFNFAGTYNETSGASKLYQIDATLTWNDVSKAGGYTSFKDWEFVKFGPRVIATNNNDPVQYFDLASSTLFADLPGSPPKGQRIAVVRDFVVLGDLVDFEPSTLAWSGYNNSELWTPDQATQSDRQEIFGRGGRIQRIVPGEYGVIFQEHSIFRMDYAGPPVIFDFSEVERGRGTPAPNSVAWLGALAFYFGYDGFYVFDGTQSQPISHNRVTKWFLNEIDVTTFDDMRAVVDRNNSLVMWAFKTSTSLPYNNRLIVYNWASERWAYGEVNTELLAEFVSTGFNLDNLDTVLPNGIDIDSIAVDSTAYLGGTLGLQAFTPDHKSADFSGAALTAEFDTVEIQGAGNQRLFTNSVRPLVEGSSATDVSVCVLSRDRLEDNPMASPERAVNDIGEANIRKNSRYQRYRVKVAGGFEHAYGVEVHQRKQAGRR